MLERFRVWIALLYLFANSLFGFALVLFPALVFISPLSLNLFYKWVDFSMSLWLRNTVFVLENVWNINIYCYTKSASREKSPVAYRQDDKLQLVISNHATNFDWMYLWSWLAQIGKLKHVRNILKNELKCIPGFGWAMQCAAFIFLERNWTFDKDTILNMLQIFRIIKNQSVIVLFPEGTNLCARSKEKSNAYAAAHALDRYEYCLHPRTTGFNAILLELIKKDGLRYITDVTIAYKGKYPVDPADLLMRGVLPEEIYILYKIHAVDHKKHLKDFTSMDVLMTMQFFCRPGVGITELKYFAFYFDLFHFCHCVNIDHEQAFWNY
ncbi:hypothetical protein GJ496_003522 [Pomphorhynchus laevis]|nr:hypothetical protein GJ496_003522 [Pomphorhynchus laevis]